MRAKVAQEILKKNKGSYDKMAGEFSGTRVKFWEELSFLAEHATPGMHVLDIGCGNGRFYPLLASRQIEYTGLDNSVGLLREAQQNNPDAKFVEGDATALPFPNASFDIAFSFAVIHHIPSKKLRAQFIREVARVLKPGNTVILTAWYLWELSKLGKLLQSFNPFGALDHGDLMLTFGKDRHQRYVHAFSKKELEKLLTKNGFNIIGSDIIARESGSGSKNIVIVAKKK